MFKKIAFGAAVLGLIIVGSAGHASAQAVSDLQAQINALLAQVASLQAQLAAQGSGGTTTTTPVTCHTFSTNMRIGDQGSEVGALQFYLRSGEQSTISSDEVSSQTFGESTASAVSAFQEKYRSSILTPAGLQFGNGFVGALTRAKLNQLYGCGITTPGSTISLSRTSGPVGTVVFVTKKLDSSPYSVWFTNGQLSSHLKFPILALQVVGDNTSGNDVFPVTIPTSLCPGKEADSCSSNFAVPTPVGNYSMYVKTVDGRMSNPVTFTVTGQTTDAVTVISPNGGESWKIGSTQGISFTAPASVNSVGIYLDAYASCPKGVLCAQYLKEYFIGTAYKNFGTYSWLVGSTNDGQKGYIPAGQYRVRIDAGQAGSDFSDAPFTLTDATTRGDASILAPSGGEQWQIGTQQVIRWTASDASFNTDEVALEPYYSCDPTAGCAPHAYRHYVLTRQPDTRNFFWTVGTTVDGSGQIPAGPYIVRIRGSFINGAAVDMSSPAFTITDNRTSDPTPSVSNGSGSVGQSFNATVSATGGTAPYSFSVSSGSLPPGLILRLIVPDCYNGSTSCGTPSYQIIGTPTQSGSYDFTITAKDSNGRTGSGSFRITIGSSTTNRPPNITNSYYSGEPVAGKAIPFTWTATDPDGDDLAWTISWGDNSGSAMACASPNARNQRNWTYSATHTYSQAGTYTVGATASDCNGLTDKDAMTVNVTNGVSTNYSITAVYGVYTLYPVNSPIQFWVTTNVGGKPAAAGDGYNIQAMFFNASDTGFGNGILPKPDGSYNGSYDSSTGYWKFNMISPTTEGAYNVRIVLYCSQIGSTCYNAGGHGPESVQVRPFTVSGGSTGPGGCGTGKGADCNPFVGDTGFAPQSNYQLANVLANAKSILESLQALFH
jgi:hypothetical protein